MSMSRQEANLTILEQLLEIAKDQPDQRFGQMLWNAGILTWDKEGGLKDPYHDEPVAILQRMERRKQEIEDQR